MIEDLIVPSLIAAIAALYGGEKLTVRDTVNALRERIKTLEERDTTQLGSLLEIVKAVQATSATTATATAANTEVLRRIEVWFLRSGEGGRAGP